MTASLGFSDISVERSAKTVISGLSGAVAPGQLLLVTGSNGSGKTTLLLCLVGLCRPTTGQVTWQGAPKCFAWCADTPAMLPKLTVQQNMSALALQPLIPTAADLMGAGLDRVAHQPVEHCSRGQQQRMSLLRVALSGRPTWVLDEPLGHLDDAGIHWWHQTMQAHLQNNGSIVMSGHQLPQTITALAHKVMAL